MLSTSTPNHVDRARGLAQRLALNLPLSPDEALEASCYLTSYAFAKDAKRRLKARKALDAFEAERNAVIRLWNHGASVTEIGRVLKISRVRTYQVLQDAGLRP